MLIRFDQIDYYILYGHGFDFIHKYYSTQRSGNIVGLPAPKFMTKTFPNSRPNME